MRKLKRDAITQQDIDERGKKEIALCLSSQSWLGGYFEGDPTLVNCISSYSSFTHSTVSPLYLCYTKCLQPYINKTVNILEIGPGRGCWTKATLQLNPKSITCVDALSAEYNQFWNYVGTSEKITYHQIKNFSLDCVPNNSIDFVWSCGTFCHISPIMIYEYFKNIYKKMRRGSQGFIMYADNDKYNRCSQKYHTPFHVDKQNDLLIMQNIRACDWYHMGIERAQQTLLELGYEVIAADVNINERDPMIHFRKN